MTVGPGLIALPATWLTLVGFPAAAVLLCGQALCAVGCAAVIVSAALVLLQPVAALLTSFQISRARYRYRATHAGLADLDELYRHWHENYGPEIVERAEYEQHLKKNPGISFKVLKYDSKDPQAQPSLVGFFDLAPLTARGEAKLRGALPNTLGLSVQDIRSPRARRGSAYYISSVATPTTADAFQRGITMAFLLAAVQELAAQGRVTIYARPATSVGFYLVRDVFAMRKIQDELPDTSAVWSLEIPKGEVKIPTEYKRLMRWLRKGAHRPG